MCLHRWITDHLGQPGGLEAEFWAGGVGGGVRVQWRKGWPGSAVIQARLEPTFMPGPETPEMLGVHSTEPRGL